jgi:hypothetical protein
MFQEEEEEDEDVEQHDTRHNYLLSAEEARSSFERWVKEKYIDGLLKVSVTCVIMSMTIII